MRDARLGLREDRERQQRRPSDVLWAVVVSCLMPKLLPEYRRGTRLLTAPQHSAVAQQTWQCAGTRAPMDLPEQPVCGVQPSPGSSIAAHRVDDERSGRCRCDDNERHDAAACGKHLPDAVFLLLFAEQCSPSSVRSTNPEARARRVR